ncbi:MAG TPA: toll/interleukin-1 receptor domain-containing protein [Polyangiaceae bacterium]|nr:toll/interleukin-1 receptor domain-containing protein [Polyangiaceae bacterium]
MQAREVLDIVTAAKVRRLTGDVPWVLVGTAVVASQFSTVLELPTIEAPFRLGAALLAGFGLCGAILRIAGHVTGFNMTSAVLGGAFFGSISGAIGGSAGFVRDASPNEQLYAFAITCGMSAIVGATWAPILDLFPLRQDWRPYLSAALGVTVGVFVSLGGAISYLTWQYVDRFDQPITPFQVALICASFVQLRAFFGLTSRTGRRSVIRRAFLIAALLSAMLWIASRFEFMNEGVYDDTPHPLVAFGICVFAPLAWASVTAWLAAALAGVFSEAGSTRAKQHARSTPPETPAEAQSNTKAERSQRRERGQQEEDMAMTKNVRLPVFLSYAHEDTEFLGRLLTHLAVFKMQDQVCAWSDTEIEPGADWASEIEFSIGNARAAVLFISQHFLASKFIRESELPRLLERRRGGLLILPLIVRPCAYDLAEFPFSAISGESGVFRLSSIQSVNPNNVPLTKLQEAAQDEVFELLARKLHAAQVGTLAK